MAASRPITGLAFHPGLFSETGRRAVNDFHHATEDIALLQVSALDVKTLTVSTPSPARVRVVADFFSEGW